jgi:ankyrin repeat protein
MESMSAFVLSETDAIGLLENRAHAQGGHEEIAHLLLGLRVNVEVKCPHGKTALEIAQENGRLAMVELLSGNCEGV